ncbi:hypothetical protein MQE22_08635 [Acidithiobacillus sp. YTS05]|nr:hypothetical protein MQE22_08635 [Acidithiobacillus sp. YTS05]
MWTHLPAFRQQRAAEERELAAGLPESAEKQSRLDHARWLEKQVTQLAGPDVEERVRARALATELSVRLTAKLRNIELSTPNVDPTSLRIFERTFQRHTRGMESQGGMNRDDAQHQARLAFLQAMIEADVSPEDPGGLQSAIVQYRKITAKTLGAEPGHLRDQSLEELGEGHGIELPAALSSAATEDPERMRGIRSLAQSLDQLAAAELRPRQYAIYQVLAHNTNLLDWRLDPDGKLRFQKRKGAEKGVNLATEVMREVGGFSGRGAAYRAVHEILDRLGEALRRLDREVVVEELPGEKQVQDREAIIRERDADRKPGPTRERIAKPGPARESAEIE